MTIRLKTEAVEQSTYQIFADFTDSAGNAVTPSSAAWSLRDSTGAIVNGRSEVAFTPLDTTVMVVLSGDDLALSSESDDGMRFFTIEARYSSDEGSNLPLNEEASFRIRKLIGVS